MASYELHVPDIANYNVKFSFHESEKIHPERIYPLHMDDKMEMYILLEGDVSFVVELSVYRLSPGDAVVVRPNERHHCILNSHSVHKYLCIWFDTSSDFLFRDFVSYAYGRNSHVVPDKADKARLLQMYGKLKIAAMEENLYRQFYTTLEILDTFRKYLPNTQRPHALPETLTQILADMDVNFKQVCTLEKICSKYYISTSTLNRLFRKHLGTTPKMYLETKRLAHSRMLLKKGESVLTACLESGFPDCSNYIRLFKKHFGKTPGQYKSEQK